jgi:hypothetical protein
MKRKDGKHGANQNLWNAAIRGGLAGGDTSHEVSPHFIYRDIVNKTIPT